MSFFWRWEALACETPWGFERFFGLAFCGDTAREKLGFSFGGGGEFLVCLVLGGWVTVSRGGIFPSC